jgi:uncharacterized protein (UPF0147 family)
MQLANFAIEDLKQLPLRAMVAFAARCARRVEHLAQLPEGHPGKEERRVAVDAALRLAEDVARGEACSAAESVVQAIDVSRRAACVAPSCESAVAAAAEAAHAAASVLSVLDRAVEDQDMPQSARTAEAHEFLGSLERSTVDLTALSAYTAAVDAFDAVGINNEGFVGPALNDFDKLLRLQLGRYPQPGDPIDASPAGPLGPILLPK